MTAPQIVGAFCIIGGAMIGELVKKWSTNSCYGGEKTLEEDEYFLRAKRIEILASITAMPFYRKMGYDYKNGITKPDAEGLLRLEKFW